MRRLLLVLGVVGSVFVTPIGALADSFDIQATPPAPSRQDRAMTRRDGVTVRPLPERQSSGAIQTLGFVGPLAARTATGRAGAAAWTTRDVPVVPGESAGARGGGMLGFGFAVEWGRGTTTEMN